MWLSERRAFEPPGIPLALNVPLCMPAMHVYMRVAVYTVAKQDC